MTTLGNPERGFFIGKVSKYAAAAAFLAVVCFPSAIKADVAPHKASTVWITAYASVPEETSEHPFVTASGELVGDGVIAANFLPFGTLVQIPELFGDKIFTVEDRMNRKFSQRVDIWMPTVRQAVNFGIRRAKVVILGADSAMAAAK